MDALDLQQNRLVSGPFAELVMGADDFPFALFTSRDTSHERGEGPAFLTFDGLVSRTGFVDDMRALLATLHAAYAHPVEVEFALNCTPGGGYRINLLQCRPLQIRNSEGASAVQPPAGVPQVVAARGAVIGPGRVIHPQRIVLVRLAQYGRLGQADRLAVTRVLGRLNQVSEGRCLLLLGPGRWGSRDLWLGIPVVFAEINHVAALCEIVAMHDNLVPDVSLGTHFLNELIEADMLYFALFPKVAGNHLDEEALCAFPNRLVELLPDAARWADMVHVVDLEPGRATLYADAERQQVVLTLGG